MKSPSSEAMPPKCPLPPKHSMAPKSLPNEPPTMPEAIPGRGVKFLPSEWPEFAICYSGQKTTPLAPIMKRKDPPALPDGRGGEQLAKPTLQPKTGAGPPVPKTAPIPIDGKYQGYNVQPQKQPKDEAAVAAETESTGVSLSPQQLNESQGEHWSASGTKQKTAERKDAPKLDLERNKKGCGLGDKPRQWTQRPPKGDHNAKWRGLPQHKRTLAAGGPPHQTEDTVQAQDRDDAERGNDPNQESQTQKDVDDAEDWKKTQTARQTAEKIPPHIPVDPTLPEVEQIREIKRRYPPMAAQDYVRRVNKMQDYPGELQKALLGSPFFKHIPASLFVITFDEGCYRLEDGTFARILYDGNDPVIREMARYDSRCFRRMEGLPASLIKSYMYNKYKLANREVLQLLGATSIRQVMGTPTVEEAKPNAGRQPAELLSKQGAIQGTEQRPPTEGGESRQEPSEGKKTQHADTETTQDGALKDQEDGHAANCGPAKARTPETCVQSTTKTSTSEDRKHTANKENRQPRNWFQKDGSAKSAKGKGKGKGRNKGKGKGKGKNEEPQSGKKRTHSQAGCQVQEETVQPRTEKDQTGPEEGGEDEQGSLLKACRTAAPAEQNEPTPPKRANGDPEENPEPVEQAAAPCAHTQSKQQGLQDQPIHEKQATPLAAYAEQLHVHKQRINKLTHEMDDAKGTSLEYWENIRGAATYRSGAVAKKRDQEEAVQQELEKGAKVDGDRNRSRSRARKERGRTEEGGKERQGLADAEMMSIPMSQLQKQKREGDLVPIEIAIRGRPNDLTRPEKAEMSRIQEEHGCNQRSDFVAPSSWFIYRCPLPGRNAPINQNGLERSYKRHLLTAHKEITHPATVTARKYNQIQTVKYFSPAPTSAALTRRNNKNTASSLTQQEANTRESQENENDEGYKSPQVTEGRAHDEGEDPGRVGEEVRTPGDHHEDDTLMEPDTGLPPPNKKETRNCCNKKTRSRKRSISAI